jgi:manganese/zinc/iron transport system substrate-binding protein
MALVAGSRRRVLRLCAALALAACSFGAAAGARAQASEPLDVVATTGMIADVVRNVAGARAEVTQLMGQGVDPHLYKATRSDVHRHAARGHGVLQRPAARG